MFISRKKECKGHTRVFMGAEFIAKVLLAKRRFVLKNATYISPSTRFSSTLSFADKPTMKRIIGGFL